MHKPAGIIVRSLNLVLFLQIIFLQWILSFYGNEFFQRFMMQLGVIKKPAPLVDTLFVLVYVVLFIGTLMYLRKKGRSYNQLFGLALATTTPGPLTKKRKIIRAFIEVMLIFIAPFLSLSVFVPFAILFTYILNYVPFSGVFAYKIFEVPVILYLFLVMFILLVLVTNIFLLVVFWKGRGLQDILTKTVVVSVGKGWNYSRQLSIIGLCLVVIFLSVNGVNYLDSNLVTITDPSKRTIRLDTLSPYTNSTLGFFITYPIDQFTPEQQVDKRNGKTTILPQILFQGKDGHNSRCIQKFSVVRMKNVHGFEKVGNKYVRHTNVGEDIFPEYLNFFEIQKNRDVIFGNVVGIASIGSRTATKVIYNPSYEKKKQVVMYFVPGNTDMYEIAYELYDHEYTTNGNWVAFPKEQCQQNQRAVEKIISTFYIL